MPTKTGEDYFRSDGNVIYLKSPYCEFYIPEDYFKDNMRFAEDRGSMIKVLGIFNVGFFVDGKLTEIRTLNAPSWIEVYVSDSETRMIQMPHSDKMEQYRVVMFYEGQKVMNSSIIQDSDNARSYLEFICKGKIPHSVPYGKAAQIWRKNQAMNGVHLGVPAVIEELILSVVYRDKNNPALKFCTNASKDLSITEYDYLTASIRQICQYASTFTALWFEDFDSMVTTSLNRTSENKSEMESPLEKIIKM